MGVQMKVVTAQATSVTSCKQLFDEEQSRAVVGLQLRKAGVQQRSKLVQGENRVGGMLFRAGVT
jgi:hypothetical protein